MNLDQIYNKYKLKSNYILSDTYEEQEEFHRTSIKKIIPLSLSMLPQKNMDISIIDIGCANGFCLDELHTLGYTNLTGVSIVKKEIEIIKKKGHNGYILDMVNLSKIKDNKYNLIYSRHSLEHAISPWLAINEMLRILKKDGLLVITIPYSTFVSNSAGTHYLVPTDIQMQAMLSKINVQSKTLFTYNKIEDTFSETTYFIKES